jgi:N-acetylglutamate synthase-like GNAT family acetyltransferase
MIEQSHGELQEWAQLERLFITINEQSQVLASAAITAIYPDHSMEFGAWAVQPILHNNKIGKQLLYHVLDQFQGNMIFAVANNHSAAIFQKLGALEMSESDLHPDIFVPCKTCNCNKKDIGDRKCADTMHDLRPLLKTGV